MNDPLYLLDKIKTQDAPPFLLEKIRLRIQATADNYMQPKQLYAMAAMFVVLMAVNYFVVAKSENTNSVRPIAQSISTNNQLYR